MNEVYKLNRCWKSHAEHGWISFIWMDANSGRKCFDRSKLTFTLTEDGSYAFDRKSANGTEFGRVRFSNGDIDSPLAWWTIFAAVHENFSYVFLCVWFFRPVPIAESANLDAFTELMPWCWRRDEHEHSTSERNRRLKWLIRRDYLGQKKKKSLMTNDEAIATSSMWLTLQLTSVYIYITSIWLLWCVLKPPRRCSFLLYTAFPAAANIFLSPYPPGPLQDPPQILV